jgi:integrase
MISQQLLANRPNLSASSVKTYESNLRNLYMNAFGYEKGDKFDIDLEKFNVPDNFKTVLEKMAPSTRKGRYSALYILTGLEEYKDAMLEDIDVYNAEKSTREPTEKQKQNAITTEEIAHKIEEMKPFVDGWFSSKNLPKIQEYLILVLYGGSYLPPRRSLDFVKFKLRNFDENQDNFLQTYTKDKKLCGRLVFNEFKTKQRGQDVIEIPTELLSILRKWKRTHQYDYLFFTAKGEEIDSSLMNQRIEKIFGKKVGINGFRSAYLTGKYSDVVDGEEQLANDMKDMGSSINMRKIYIRKKV